MIQEVWLVRHGETEWSKSGQHTSFTDLPLLPEGAEAAEKLRERLAGQHFDLVWSSPRQRATETARLAGFERPEIVEDLVEWNYGAGEGLTTPQIQELVPNWRIWTHGAPIIADGADGESRAEVTARLQRVVDRLRSSDAERALLFGHGHCLRALATVWCDMLISDGWHFPMKTASVSVLGWEKDTPALVRWNS